MAESENETRMTPNYTFVGDNIDKNVTPRYMRVDKQVESIHAWHSYATLDRYNAADASKNVTMLLHSILVLLHVFLQCLRIPYESHIP